MANTPNSLRRLPVAERRAFVEANERDVPQHVALLAERAPHLLDGLREYAIHRRPVGSFLGSVIADSLSLAVAHADPVSLTLLRNLVVYCNNVLPGAAYGSHAAYDWWTETDPSELTRP